MTCAFLWGEFPVIFKFSYFFKEFRYLRVLSNALAERCKDELRKEAVVEECSKNRKIRFEIIDDDEYKKGGNKNGYCRCRMVNGDLVMETKVHSFCTNVEYVCFLRYF